MSELTLKLSGEEFVFLQNHLREHMEALEREGVTSLMDKMFDAELQTLYKEYCKTTPLDERYTIEEFCDKLDDPEFADSFMEEEYKTNNNETL